MESHEFIGLIRSIAREEIEGDAFALGTIPANYLSGRPAIQFDGESSASIRTYPYLSSYAPAANDRVLLGRAGHTWVVLGKVI